MRADAGRRARSPLPSPRWRQADVSRLNELLRRGSTVRELVRFLWREKLWWLVPMVVVLVAVGALLVFAQGSALAPFVYTLF